ncbi:MAG: flavodoxin [Clostridiales bacterium]|nr:flavodoxin [Clostridiales bacterium]
MKSIILYYSRSGNTKKVALKIKERFGADMLFVEPRNAYGNYASALIRFGKEKMQKEIPEVAIEPADLAEYEAVFIGFPVWGGVMPDFMKEYLKRCNLVGKIVIPFVTAGTNGKASVLRGMKQLAPGVREDLYYYTNLLKRYDANKWLDRVEETLG